MDGPFRLLRRGVDVAAVRGECAWIPGDLWPDLPDEPSVDDDGEVYAVAWNPDRTAAAILRHHPSRARIFVHGVAARSAEGLAGLIAGLRRFVDAYAGFAPGGLWISPNYTRVHPPPGLTVPDVYERFERCA